MSFGHLSRWRQYDSNSDRSATLILGFLLVFAWAVIATAHDQEISFKTADQLIDEAGQAKSHGQPALAYSLLHQVVRIAPDNSLARWQLGQVKVDDEWLSVEEAQRRAEGDPRLAKYQERKETLGDLPKGQLALARWCRGN